MALFMLGFVLPADRTYDFYFPGVKAGTCVERWDGGRLILESRPTFAKPSTINVDPNSVKPTYSPTQPGLLPFVLAKYDRSKRGWQKLTVTDLATQKPRDLNIELYRDGASREWRLESPPTSEAIIRTDDRNRVLDWWVPARNYEIVCRGYESLRPSAKYEGRVSPARFDVTVDRDARIPMRDGVTLGADVYRPSTPGKYPVLLQRTCYDRSEFGNADGAFYAQRGYIYVTEHVRGRGTSEGEFEPERHELADGYDTVAWCGTQQWSTGKVGMLGASYNAYCCWMGAESHPKWLKTVASFVPMPGPPYGEPWAGGAFYVSAELSWFGLLRDKAKVQAYNNDLTDSTNALPIGKADTVQFGHTVKQYQERIHQDRYNSTVAMSSYQSGLNSIDMPVLYFDGWLDTVAVGTRRDYDSLVKRGVKNQKLIWGPWDHFTNQESRVGLTDFSPDGYVDVRTIELRWFDRWLKGVRNGIDKEPPVSQFMLGENKWYAANQWPPKNMATQRWFLRSTGLSTVKPGQEAASRYTYDPAQWKTDRNQAYGFFFGKGMDVTDLCKHNGQLIFDSAILKHPLSLDGPIRAHLFASTDAKDTDWTMTLADLRPDGVAVGIQSGFVRARFRKSFANPVLLKPGKIYAYDLDLWQTGIRIPPGHRLRVIVSSTLFPDMDRNLNTGESIADGTRMVAAHQKVYHDAKHASYIELPVIRNGSPA